MDSRLVDPKDNSDVHQLDPEAHSALPKTGNEDAFDSSYFEGKVTPLGPGATSSNYEKKSLLVNRELDRMRMGKYQWCIWVLGGFGYFLDLLWAQVFGLIIVPMSQEMAVSGASQANIFTAFSAGLTVGALTWGLLVDIIGRRWSFNLTCLITGVFGTLVAAPPDNFKAVCAITALCGFGLGGNIPIDATIVLEFLPQKRRWLLATLSMFQPIGVTVCTILAYGLVPKYSCVSTLPACSTGQTPCCTRSSNMGWRYLVIVQGAITFGIFILRFFVFKFKESPRYLLAKGRDQEAIDVIHYIARFNKAGTPQLDLSHFQAIDQASTMTSDGSTRPLVGGVAQEGTLRLRKTFSHLKGLFATRITAISTVLLWIAYMGDFWAFNLAGGFLPIILARRSVAQSQTTQELYRQYIYIYLPGILGSFMASGFMELPRVGRKWGMVFGAAMMAVTMFLYVAVDSVAKSVGLNALEYIFQTFLNAILYAFTPELFPAPYRGSACGITSTLGRLAGIVAPKAAAPFNVPSSNGILYMAGGGSLVAMVALALLPVETRGRETY